MSVLDHEVTPHDDNRIILEVTAEAMRMRAWLIAIRLYGLETGNAGLLSKVARALEPDEWPR